MENLSGVFDKQKRKKKHMKRLSFITQFKIEFLPQFIGCRKVPGKMPERSFPFLYIVHETVVDCFSYFFERHCEYNV